MKWPSTLSLHNEWRTYSIYVCIRYVCIMKSRDSSAPASGQREFPVPPRVRQHADYQSLLICFNERRTRKWVKCAREQSKLQKSNNRNQQNVRENNGKIEGKKFMKVFHFLDFCVLSFYKQSAHIVLFPCPTLHRIGLHTLPAPALSLICAASILYCSIRAYTTAAHTYTRNMAVVSFYFSFVFSFISLVFCFLLFFQRLPRHFDIKDKSNNNINNNTAAEAAQKP